MIALVCPPAAYLLLDLVAAVMLVMGLAIVPSKLFCA